MKAAIDMMKKNQIKPDRVLGRVYGMEKALKHIEECVKKDVFLA